MPMNAQYRGPIELPGTIPVFPLPGALLLPRGQMPLNIFEPRYLAMVDDALRDGHRHRKWQVSCGKRQAHFSIIHIDRRIETIAVFCLPGWLPAPPPLSTVRGMAAFVARLVLPSNFLSFPFHQF